MTRSRDLADFADSAANAEGARPLILYTAQTASGTSVDFNDIPSGAKRITVMFSNLSTNGTSLPLVQIGDAGGIEDTGYISTSSSIPNGSSPNTSGSTAGFAIRSTQASNIISGHMVITFVGSNLWVSSHALKQDTAATMTGAGEKTLSDTLTRLRITTTNGTDTFDSGTINIMVEV